MAHALPDLARWRRTTSSACASAASWTRIAVASGRESRLTHILCRPGTIVGEVDVPPGTGFVGINSMVRHSVAGNAYGNVRIGAFMGKKMINEIRARTGRAALNYLTEISSAEFKAEYEKRDSRKTILGSDFLAHYKTHDVDPVTTIQPDATYRVVGPARHPVAENERVLKFITALQAANGGEEKALIEAGELMYGAHESYRDNCHLSVPEVISLVESGAEKRVGRKRGFYGAKITGGGNKGDRGGVR